MWFDPSILISIILEAIDKNPPTVEVHVPKSPLYAMNNYINYNKNFQLTGKLAFKLYIWY